MTPAYLKSLKKESVVQSVINRLTDAMKSGELKPGDKIPTEPELAESLGIARSSVREAIKILIDPMVYGIILNKDSFENLMELREMTEAGMMRLAIVHHDEDQLEELRDILEEMKGTLGSEDPVAAFFTVDEKFHDKIAEMGKNPMADKVNRVVRTLTHAVRFKTVSSMIEGGRGEELVDAHRSLLEAIRRSNEEELSDKVRDSYFVDELAEQNELAGQEA